MPNYQTQQPKADKELVEKFEKLSIFLEKAIKDVNKPESQLIGWVSSCSNDCPQGFSSCKHFEQCRLVGEGLLGFKKGDTVGMIYDSDKNILRFELNEKMLDSQVIKVPNDKGLFWFVGKSVDTGTMAVSIVDVSN